MARQSFIASTWARTFAAVAGLAIGLGTTGCSPDEQVDYSQQNRDDFLAACTAPLEDDLLRIGLCQCVFDDLQVAIPYGRFDEVDDRLVATPTAELPPDVVSVIAKCVIEEADL